MFIKSRLIHSDIRSDVVVHTDPSQAKERRHERTITTEKKPRLKSHETEEERHVVAERERSANVI